MNNLPCVDRILNAQTPAQGTTAWLNWRKSRLTASDACKIVGDAVKTRASLIKSKTDPNAMVFSGNEFTISGHLSEPIAAAKYAAETGFKLFTDLKPVEHPDYPWLAASLDGVTACGRNVEIKTLHGTKLNKKPKPVHFNQSQIQMEVTGLQVTDLVYYYVDLQKMDIHTIYYDKMWFANVLPKFQAFIQDLQQASASKYEIEFWDEEYEDEFLDDEEEQYVLEYNEFVWPFDSSMMIVVNDDNNYC